MERLNTILNTIMGAFAGVFIGYTIYIVWDFKTRPGLYALTPAPWYSSILVHGVVTLAVLMICAVVKVIVKRKTDFYGTAKLEIIWIMCWIFFEGGAL